MAAQKVRIVDVEPVRYGVAAGETATRVVVWRLFFADFRVNFQSPRGGRLAVGLLNSSAATAAPDSASLPARRTRSPPPRPRRRPTAS